MFDLLGSIVAGSANFRQSSDDILAGLFYFLADLFRNFKVDLRDRKLRDLVKSGGCFEFWEGLGGIKCKHFTASILDAIQSHGGVVLELLFEVVLSFGGLEGD
jgi:hypothetical protein